MTSPLFFHYRQPLIYYWIIFICFLPGTACNSDSHNSQKTLAAPEELIDSLNTSREGIISEVTIASDTSQSYFLYVPSNVDTNALLIVFFDPGANGKKPVAKYQTLAKRYGIILAGSNNSKNGLSREESSAIAKKIVNDVQTRFNIKRTNIIACGFSGGARVAVLTALGENLPGVIGCGAGFPGKPDKNYGFSYVGIVGNEDFNFLELKRLYFELDRVRMKHQLLVFDGKHEWAPESELEKAILLLKSNSETKQMLALKIDSSIAAYKKEKNWIRLYDELRLGITSGLDSAHIASWKAELSALRKIPDCIAELKKEAEIETKEAELQTEIARAFSAQNFMLLENKISLLNQLSSKKSSLQKVSDKRSVQFISLMSFLYTEKALASNLSLAKKYLNIYAKADPENPDYHYLLASYYAKSNEKSSALTALQHAVDAGFDDFEKIQNNPAFQTLFQEPDFSAITQRISNK